MRRVPGLRFAPITQHVPSRWYALGSALALTLATCVSAAPIDPTSSNATTSELWTLLDRPPGQAQGAFVVDVANDRIVAFGGAAVSNYVESNVWVRPLSGTQWSPLATSGTAPQPPDYQAIAIYDPVRQRLLVNAGTGGAAGLEMWSLTLDANPTWSHLSTSGTGPDVNRLQRSVYDPIRDRMMVTDVDGKLFALDLSAAPTWSVLISPGTPRYGHSLVYDSTRDQLIMFGGCTSSLDCSQSFRFSNEVWVCPLYGTPSWTQLIVSGTLPPGIKWHQAVYDAGRERMTVVFGRTAFGPNAQVWTLDYAAGPTWVAVATTGTPPLTRDFPNAIVDESRDQVIVHGGVGAELFADTWSLGLAPPNEWTRRDAPSPGGRRGSTAIADPVRHRLLVFGGFDGTFRNDVWQVPLDAAPIWSLVATAGTAPAARYAHNAIYDPAGDRMIVFGGYDGATCRNDVLALSLAGAPTWSTLSPAGTKPLGRAQAAAAFDSVRRRLIVFGGQQCDNTNLGDTWVLSLAPGGTWSQIGAGTHPDPRRNPTLIVDPRRDRLVVFGGVGSASPYADTWSLPLATPANWALVPPGASNPDRRFGHVAIYDPVRDGMVIYGGDPGGLGNTVNPWELDFVADQWMALDPPADPPYHRFHAAAYDAAGARMLTYGGDWSGLILHDLWSLSLPVQTAVGDPREGRALLIRASPNPGRGGFVVSFDLARAAHVRVDVFDVVGRRVAGLLDAELPSGSHRVPWNARDESGRAVVPGVYHVRLDAGGERRTTMIVSLQ